jgi:5,10-methylenetetrahydromethanopterin reductase
MEGKRALGLALGSTVNPAELEAVCATTESSGFGEIWLAEDYFYTAGASAATFALAHTQTIPVGVGVFSAMTRHPALLAMELSTMAALFPGRIRAGIGLGGVQWLRQMGLVPQSAVSAVRSCIEAVRRLLEGERLTEENDLARFVDVALAYPPRVPVPIYLGGNGPKMLALSGRAADGTVTAIATNPAFVAWARSIVHGAAEASGRSPEQHRVHSFVLFSMNEDGDLARRAARRRLARNLGYGRNLITDRLGISDELEELLSEVGVAGLEAAIPDAWVRDLTVSGTPDECRERIGAYFDAGADVVVLFPAQMAELGGVVEAAGRELGTAIR